MSRISGELTIRDSGRVVSVWWRCDHYVNRVILISDGLANQGITDPIRLNRIAHKFRDKAISLTTMGVGLEYNENLMIGLSEAGGGNYYFIENPANLASIMNRELNTLSSVVAQNASIELTPGREVQVANVIGCESFNRDGRLVIQVGDIHANETREFTVELLIPEGTGTLTVAKGELYYESNCIRLALPPRFTVTTRYTHDAAQIDKHKDWDTQARIDVAVSTQKVEKAMNALDEGRQEEAVRTLKEASQVLMDSPAVLMSASGATQVSEQAANIQNYVSMLKDSTEDSRKAKKAIQYDNYRVQKRK